MGKYTYDGNMQVKENTNMNKQRCNSSISTSLYIKYFEIKLILKGKG